MRLQRGELLIGVCSIMAIPKSLRGFGVIYSGVSGWRASQLIGLNRQTYGNRNVVAEICSRKRRTITMIGAIFFALIGFFIGGPVGAIIGLLIGIMGAMGKAKAR
jgi:hypothetical protein